MKYPNPQTCWHDVQIKNGNYIFAMLLFLSLEKKGKINPGISVAKSLLLKVFVPVDLPPVHLLK